jgi:fucose permease
MDTNQNKQSYALPIAMMFALFFMIAFVTGLQNPMGVIVKNQFQASNLLSQLGNFANFLAYAFMGIPAGLMLQKIGYKKTALTAILVGIAEAKKQSPTWEMAKFKNIAGIGTREINSYGINAIKNFLNGGIKK